MPNPLLDLDSASVHLILSVAELGSISKAASRHGLSQPSASRRVKDLERRVGVELIDRSTGGASLSAAGMHLAEQLRDVVSATETLLDAANSYRSKDQLALTIAATRPTLRLDLPTIASELRASFSAPSPVTLRLSIQVMSTLDVCNAVRDSLVGIGIVDGPRVPLGLSASTIKMVPLQVVVNPDHLWARRRRTVSDDELTSTSLLLPQRKTGTRDVIEEALRSPDGQRLAVPALEADSDQRIALASLGPHPAIVRPEAAAPALESGQLVAIKTATTINQPIRLIWKGKRPGDEGSARFIEIATAGS